MIYIPSREEEPSAVYMFKQSPPEVLDETETSSAIKFAIKAVKLLIYLVTFTLVLASAVASRMSLLFITSQLKIPTTETALNGTRKVCRAGLGTCTFECNVSSASHDS